MPSSIIYLLGFITILSCGAFAYGIFKACIISLAKQPDVSKMPLFLSSTVTSIAAVLATNVGAVLGITIANPSSSFRTTGLWNPLTFFSQPNANSLQIVACYFYILGLLAAALTWAIRNFNTDTKIVVPLIPELTKSLLGIMVGALALSLSIRK